MNEDIQKFVAYLGVSDTLIEQATKEEIAEVARVLALHVAHYRQRYGDVSIEESLEMLRTEKISDEMAKTLADGKDAAHYRKFDSTIRSLVRLLNAHSELQTTAPDVFRFRQTEANALYCPRTKTVDENLLARCGLYLWLTGTVYLHFVSS